MDLDAFVHLAELAVSLLPAFHRSGADEPAVIIFRIDASRKWDSRQVLLAIVDLAPDGTLLLLQMGRRLSQSHLRLMAYPEHLVEVLAEDAHGPIILHLKLVLEFRMAHSEPMGNEKGILPDQGRTGLELVTSPPADIDALGRSGLGTLGALILRKDVLDFLGPSIIILDLLTNDLLLDQGHEEMVAKSLQAEADRLRLWQD